MKVFRSTVLAVGCSWIMLAAGTVFGTPPDLPPRPIEVETIPVPGSDDMVDLHVMVLMSRPCSSMTLLLETKGELQAIGSDRAAFVLASVGGSPIAGAFDTTLTVRVAPDDTGSVIITVSGCDMDWSYPELLFITTGDSLEIRHRQPILRAPYEGATQVYKVYRNAKKDTTKYTYTFDLTKPEHFDLVKSLVTRSVWTSEEPLTEPGTYAVSLTKSDFHRAIRKGMIGWPAGERPDSIQTPDSTDGGSSSAD